CLLLLSGITFLYTSDSIMQAFALVTTVAALLFLFTWSLIVVCYIVYRRKRPQLHEESIYKMPGGVPMCWVVLAFFTISLVILTLDPTT
ncbi:amino acid transporter, partial [Vibrio cholerae O1 biovar El Tor]|nr:amino acid transporter [Vibrio cholerae O1 biovar El Tor]